MIFPVGTVILRNDHAIGAYIPGDSPLLLDVRDCKTEVRYAWLSGAFKYSRMASLPCTASWCGGR